MIAKNEEIQRQILIYLIEDQAVSQKKASKPNKSVAPIGDKQELSNEGKHNPPSSLNAALNNQNSNQIAQNTTKSLYEESNNSVYSFTPQIPNQKKSDEIIQADSDNKKKEQEGNEPSEKPLKVFPLDTIKYSLQLIGFKYKDASYFCDILKQYYKQIVSMQSNYQPSLQDAFGKFKMARTYMLSSQLYKGIVEFAQSNNYIKPHKENAPVKLIQYFDMCMQILQKKYPLIILLGGTSGTGKSTLSSILASRFQIPTVLSTDSIRHIMRNFMEESEEPLLFSSTYEAGKILKDDTITKESKKTIQGYKIQCKLVQQKLENVIMQYAKKNEPMIIEGVHLTPRFMFSMMKKYPYVIPFTICIEKESKHRQRFAVRSKYMTLDKKKNKYIQYISNIRMIQAWFMEKSDEHLIPKINNVNIDKSVNIIHRVVTTYMRSMINDDMSVIPDKSVNALKLYKSFNKVIKPLINKFSVSQEVNKNIIMQKFLDDINQEENQNINSQNDQIQDKVSNSSVQKANSVNGNSNDSPTNALNSNYLNINNESSNLNTIRSHQSSVCLSDTNQIQITKSNSISQQNNSINNQTKPNQINSQNISNQSNISITNNNNNNNLNIINNNNNNNNNITIQNINNTTNNNNSINSNNSNNSNSSNAINGQQQTNSNGISTEGKNLQNNCQPVIQISTIETIFPSRKMSPSIDILNSEQPINHQTQNNEQTQDQLILQKNLSQNQSGQTVQTNGAHISNKDSKMLLSLFLNDLENNHPKSFVQYTIKKIEDIRQTALKEYQNGSPLISYQAHHGLNINKIQLNSDQSQEKKQNINQEATNDQSNVQQTLHKNQNVVGDISNAVSSSIDQIQQNQISKQNDIQEDQISQNQNHDVIQKQEKVNLKNIQKELETAIKSFEIQVNGQQIENFKEQGLQKDIQTEQPQSQSSSNLDNKIVINDTKKSKRKIKAQIDERSNLVTIHSSHNEEQVNNEQQSEGDSLRMGEDNYQFDALTEGDEESKSLSNSEHSNSIDDEEEEDYHDNFGQQSDESSDQDDEKKDDTQVNDNEDDEEYEDYDQDDETQKKYQSEKVKINNAFKFDVVQELDPQQLESLSYEGYQNYIKAIKEIVEATVNEEKLKVEQILKLEIAKGQQTQRKKIRHSKSQLFNQEEDVKSKASDLYKKKRQRSYRHDQLINFQKKDSETGTPISYSQHHSHQNLMTNSGTFTKKRTNKSRGSRKTILSQMNVSSTTKMIEKEEVMSPNPSQENRAKSCDPDKTINPQSQVKDKKVVLIKEIQQIVETENTKQSGQHVIQQS
ncbi:AAA domain protein (macronuclear) [Tetrahymena thermophila SB210]|uniref:AAA domain protein n=1 Tax=Tetrahymena thermophila (strain SB210) TaxID=312017 RepID=I7M8T9_TETTS|nr:AAA domain protein [Tetrahymena thermophila SB210]EAR99658.2 AAA domain protein [Tetrahymena thermophila SB210]|eukprot:XP_001019903.2 AAA domain protein [Tetrahymena thermophila SB210]